MRRRMILAAVTLLGVALPACGGTGGGSATVTPSRPAQDGQRVSGSIVIHIPSASQASSAALRRIRYVSASSYSTKIGVTAAQGCTQCSSAVTLEVALTPASGLCVTSGTTKTCTIPLNLLPGSYVGTMRAYDGLLDGQGHVTGNPLSENTSFPIVIASGQNNATPVTLGGVPASIQTTVLTPSTLMVDSTGGAANTVYRVSTGGASAQFSFVTRDAQTNIIVGPGTPAFTLAASGGGFNASLSGNTVTVTAPATVSRQTGSLTLSSASPACSEPIATCSLNVKLGFVQLMAAADSSRVLVWPIGGSAPRATLTTGVSTPSAVAFGSDGTLFVANYGNNTVTAYAPPYTAPPAVISTKVSGPVALAVDASNDLIVINKTAGNMTLYAPPYTGAPFTFSSLANPVDVRVDGNHLWALSGFGYLYRYSPPFTGSAPDVVFDGGVSTFGAPAALAIDAGGRPYVADGGKNTIVRFDQPFVSHSAPNLTIPDTAGQPITQPRALAVAPDGTIFLATVYGISSYSSSGAPLGAQGGLPPFFSTEVLAVDADATVWFALDLGAPVGYSPPYAVGTGTFKAFAPSGFNGPNALAIFP